MLLWILSILFIEIFFFFVFALTNGHIIDTKLKLHKYEKENYKEIFYLKNKKSVNTYCVKHSEMENVKKLKHYKPGGGKENRYKVTKPTDRDNKTK